ncbi:MAG: hypothetical protein J7578_04360, partial [Chitinophagaceae bacterium]|nr:hypothetical protein [Chitinophagaceae bacterium]
MKAPVSLACFALICAQSIGQQMKNRNVKVYKQYPALVKQLTKQNTWKPVFPDSLTHYFGRSAMQMDDILFPYSEMRFKPRINSEAPEMYMIVEAKGISNLKAQGVRKTSNGYVIDYTYNFPCRLLITDQDKKTIYSFDINAASAVQELAFLKSTPTFGSLSYVEQYFPLEEEAAAYMNYNKNAARFVEKYAMRKAYSDIAKIMTTLYHNYSEFSWVKCIEVDDPKGVPELVELNNAAGLLKQGSELLNDEKTEEAFKILQSSKEILEKYKNTDNAAFTPRIKKMIENNLSWITWLTGDKMLDENRDYEAYR